MTDETTSELLAEIDRDMADIERQVAELVEEAQRADHKTQELPKYTPPEGWRVVQFGEELLPGDVWVNHDGTEQRSNILHWDAASVSGGRCIRRIEPEPQPAQVCEGRWRTRNGEIKDIRPCEPLKGAYYVWPWTDGFMTYQDNGRHLAAESDNDLVEYLGPIKPEPQPEPNTAAIEELRSEVSYVQNLLGTERRRVTELEELVGSLRTINRGCENAVRDAGKENTALKNQLAAVKAELASVAADRQRLRVELDAAQQVPADSPELQQLRADLAEVTRDRDTYRDGYDRVLSDLRTIRETTAADTVETIAEWLEPIRLVDSAYLANATMQHLPQIMRTLTGLDSHAID